VHISTGPSFPARDGACESRRLEYHYPQTSAHYERVDHRPQIVRLPAEKYANRIELTDGRAKRSCRGQQALAREHLEQANRA
jgi:hypothetical protein